MTETLHYVKTRVPCVVMIFDYVSDVRYDEKYGPDRNHETLYNFKGITMH